MLDPRDNKALVCFVKEQNIPKEVKIALYPQLQELFNTVANFGAKTKELFYRATRKTRIEKLFETKPLELSNFLFEMSNCLEQFTGKVQSAEKECFDGMTTLFQELAKRIDLQRSDDKTPALSEVTGSVQSYVSSAEKRRKDIFENNKRELLAQLLWEQSTLNESPAEIRQPSADSTTERSVRLETQPVKFDSFEYKEYVISSQPRAVEPARAIQPEASNQQTPVETGDEVSLFEVAA